jgi:hypothetical protein
VTEEPEQSFAEMTDAREALAELRRVFQLPYMWVVGAAPPEDHETLKAVRREIEAYLGELPDDITIDQLREQAWTFLASVGDRTDILRIVMATLLTELGFKDRVRAKWFTRED